MTTFTTQDRKDAERTPLTNEELQKLVLDNIFTYDLDDLIEFARAIERAHGIGESND